MDKLRFKEEFVFAKIHCSKAGITVLELILKLLIIATLLGIFIFTFAKNNAEFNDSQAQAKLQTEGEKIQKSLEEIETGGVSVENIFPNKDSGEIDYIVFKSNREENGVPLYFRIQKSGKKLIVTKDVSVSFSNSNNDEIISENVDKLYINKNLNDKSIDFKIDLKKSKWFIYSINQEVNYGMNIN